MQERSGNGWPKLVVMPVDDVVVADAVTGVLVCAAACAANGTFCTRAGFRV